MQNVIRYNVDFINSYNPNKTLYLGDTTDILYEGNISKISNLDYILKKRIYKKMIIDLSWASSVLEGNTYSLLETEQLILYGKKATGKDDVECTMILNHKNAINFILAIEKDLSINAHTTRTIHSLLLNNLLADRNDQGQIRRCPVYIGGSNYCPLSYTNQILDVFNLIFEKTNAIDNPFEQSFFLLTNIAYLQPFIDGNRRTSRLVANIPLIKNNLLPLSFRNVEKNIYVDALLDIYEQNNVKKFADLFLQTYKLNCRDFKQSLNLLSQEESSRNFFSPR